MIFAVSAATPSSAGIGLTLVDIEGFLFMATECFPAFLSALGQPTHLASTARPRRQVAVLVMVSLHICPSHCRDDRSSRCVDFDIRHDPCSSLCRDGGHRVDLDGCHRWRPTRGR